LAAISPKIPVKKRQFVPPYKQDLRDVPTPQY
jgi:hypothetical protein